MSIATAQISSTTLERVAAAAVLWCADQGCSLALAELEDAVAELAAQPAEAGTALANVLAIVERIPASRAATPSSDPA